MKRTLLISLGTVSLILGALGAVLPLLPTVPFLLFSVCCYAKSSKRLHTWLLNTALYKQNLESYVQGKGMTARTKLRIMTAVTLMMGTLPVRSRMLRVRKTSRTRPMAL